MLNRKNGLRLEDHPPDGPSHGRIEEYDEQREDQVVEGQVGQLGPVIPAPSVSCENGFDVGTSHLADYAGRQHR